MFQDYYQISSFVWYDTKNSNVLVYAQHYHWGAKSTTYINSQKEKDKGSQKKKWEYMR